MSLNLMLGIHLPSTLLGLEAIPILVYLRWDTRYGHHGYVKNAYISTTVTLTIRGNSSRGRVEKT